MPLPKSMRPVKSVRPIYSAQDAVYKSIYNKLLTSPLFHGFSACLDPAGLFGFFAARPHPVHWCQRVGGNHLQFVYLEPRHHALCRRVHHK